MNKSVDYFFKLFFFINSNSIYSQLVLLFTKPKCKPVHNAYKVTFTALSYTKQFKKYLSIKSSLKLKKANVCGSAGANCIEINVSILYI